VSFTASVDIDALLADTDDEIAAIEAAARPAAQAGAQVLYDAVKANVRRLGKKTGNLEGAIQQAYATKEGRAGFARYDISWSHIKAPHGHLLEDGWIQRYAVYMGKNGKWYTLVRPEKRGTPKPKRSAPQSVKDAYYVLRPGGPVQHPAKAFVRSAAQYIPAAEDAMEKRFFEELDKR